MSEQRHPRKLPTAVDFTFSSDIEDIYSRKRESIPTSPSSLQPLLVPLLTMEGSREYVCLHILWILLSALFHRIGRGTNNYIFASLSLLM